MQVWVINYSFEQYFFNGLSVFDLEKKCIIPDKSALKKLLRIKSALFSVIISKITKRYSRYDQNSQALRDN